MTAPRWCGACKMWHHSEPCPHAGTRLNYIIGAETWYCEAASAGRDADLRNEIRVGRDTYTSDGTDDGCVWEFTIQLVPLGGGHHSALQVAVFDDAWVAFAECDRLFAALANLSTHKDRDAQPTLADVVTILNDLGFTDDTPRTRP